ncbi:MAG TPA: hypothetical protein VFP84_05110 [Kofleriaceae bacterium]|nr:hypothetical protein [Kofleriaceae bacterium]
MVLLAGCGFQASAASDIAGPAPDAGPGTPAQDGPAVTTCWKIQDPDGARWSTCTSAALPASIDVARSVSIDTATGQASVAGFECVALTVDVRGGDFTTSPLCAVIAQSIKIEPNVTLSAHGSKPFALLAHSIEIEGVIDVASHVNGDRGPGTTQGCNELTPATQGGGGAGGTFDSPVDDKGGGAPGGDEGGAGKTGGKPAGTISTIFLRPGCDGGAGGVGDGAPPLAGGAAGGAIWIAADTGSLILGASAVINASGAGGLAGARANQGGSGGGSGGLIVLQAPSLTVDPMAKVFANGGGGGGGAQGDDPGDPGHEPIDPPDNPAGPNDTDGSGGIGYSIAHNSKPGKVGGGDGGGGGGGGGGAGVIRVVTRSATPPKSPNISPPAGSWAATP